MSSSCMPRICISCRRTIALSLQHARSLRHERAARYLSYTNAERQRAADPSTHGGDQPEVISSNDEMLKAAEPGGVSHTPPLGRYSRAPLSPKTLLTELEATPYVRRKLSLDKPHPMLVKQEGQRRSLNQTMIDIMRLTRRRAYMSAWHKLRHLRSTFDDEQIAAFKETHRYDELVQELIQTPVKVWITQETSRGRAATKTPPSGELPSDQDGPYNPCGVCEILGSLHLLTPGVTVAILALTLRSIVRVSHSKLNRSRKVMLDSSLREVVRIWHLALSRHLKRGSIAQSLLATNKDTSEPWDWSFLPSQDELDKVPLVTSGSLNDVLGLYMPTSLRARGDFASAALMTQQALAQSWKRPLQGGEAADEAASELPLAYIPLQTFLNKLISLAPEVPQQQSHAQRKPAPEPASEALGIEAQENPKAYKPQFAAPEEPLADRSGVFDFLSHIRRDGVRAIRLQDAALADQICSVSLRYISVNEPSEDYKMQICASVIFMYARMSLFKRAVQVAAVMIDLGCAPSTKIWTELLRGCARSTDTKAVSFLWQEMLRHGVVLDSHAWSARVLALVTHKHYELAWAALNEMAKLWNDHEGKRAPERGSLQNSTTGHDLDAGSDITSTKNGSKTTASSPPAQPTTAVANTLLSGLIEAGGRPMHEMLGNVLIWIKRQGLKYDIDTYNPLLKYASLSGELDRVVQLMDNLKNEGLQPNAQSGQPLINVLFQGDYLGKLSSEEQAKRILELIDDIEENHINTSLDKKGYALAISLTVKKFHNLKAAELLMARMRRKNIPVTVHVYTILFQAILRGDEPDVAAFEALWYTIKYKNGLWGDVDDFLFDELLKSLCKYHRTLGLEKILEILNFLPQRKIRPGYEALLMAAKVLREREEHERFEKLVHNIRTSSYVMPLVSARGWGHARFWEYVFSTGLLAKDGIQTYRDMWRLDRTRKLEKRVSGKALML